MVNEPSANMRKTMNWLWTTGRNTQQGQAVEECFYHIANNAQVPILLGYVDAGKKEAGLRFLYAKRRLRQGHGRNQSILRQ